MNRFLVKLNRIISYILIPVFILMMITGYRNLGHFEFITRAFANSLHQISLNIVFLVLVTVHTLIGVRQALFRKKVKGVYIEVLLILSGIIFIGGFAYFAFF